MSPWIDFKELRKRLSFPAVLEHYRVKLTVKGSQAQGFCPLPTHKGNRTSSSFSANLQRGIWQCFGCGAKGNVLDFAIRMERLSPDDNSDVRIVALKLRARFQIDVATQNPAHTPGVTKSGKDNAGSSPRRVDHVAAQPLLIPVSSPSTAATPTTAAVRINEPLDFELKGLQPNHPYLLGRGFTPETIRYFGLGYCARGFMAGRIVIPLHDSIGRLIGYAGRVVDDSTIGEDVPKYKFPSRRERQGVVHEFDKSRFLYNAHRIAMPVDQLVMVEGLASVWWLHQAGIRNVVALMGDSCSQEQIQEILDKTSPIARVSVLPNGGDTGEGCALSIFASVGLHRWVRWTRLPERKQPTDFQPTELEGLLRP